MDHKTIDWNEVPKVLNKEQFYKLCHISKTTALYLLRSGKVPSKHSGKKTRSYQIRKKHIKEYLEKREIHPETYLAPDGWYVGGHPADRIEVWEKITADMQIFFKEKLCAYKSDILTTNDICDFTGYSKSAVNRWCRTKKLKSLGEKANIIPKVFLIDFLNSKAFKEINVKSKKHIDLIKEFVVLHNQQIVEVTPNEGSV
jgi:hypothetical protein